MADKEQKNTELRMRIPHGHREILEEYCRVFGTTPSSTISDDFDPPKEIAEKHELDHEKAVSLFIDWAKGKGHVQADWTACFRNACRTWIKDKMPRTQGDQVLREITLD